MDQRTADACVYPALALTTTLYAIALDHNKQYAPPDRKIEPDWTLIEVIIGSLICLVAAAIRARLGPADRRTTERAVWLAFLIGGTPIGAWQLWRGHQRRQQRRGTLQQYDRENNHANASKRSPAALADQRRPVSPADRGDGRGSRGASTPGAHDAGADSRRGV